MTRDRIRFLMLQPRLIFNAHFSRSTWRPGGFNRSNLPLKLLYHNGAVYMLTGYHVSCNQGFGFGSDNQNNECGVAKIDRWRREPRGLLVGL